MAGFRWVECKITALYNCPGSKRHLEKLLSFLPATLDETYERMLSGINPEFVDDSKRILRLLCFAVSPLRVEEIIEALAVELGDDPWFNPDGHMETGDDICRLCPGPGLINVYTQRHFEHP